MIEIAFVSGVLLISYGLYRFGRWINHQCHGECHASKRNHD